MAISKILIANRGEIAIRIGRTAADMGISTVAVYSVDDSRSLHVLAADQACPLEGSGTSAYLDTEQLINIARREACDAIHPGYGFLSENTAFARRCLQEGLIFIGPDPDILHLFGDKIKARSLANACNVPLIAGTSGPTSLSEARSFFESLGHHGAIMIKAVLGGGGRGIRAVHSLSDLDEAYSRCRSEAQSTFGSDDVYVEQLIDKPRHIEVQIVGDGTHSIHLGERDCTLQRRNQKLLEITPCPTLSSRLRDRITDAALRMARMSKYKNIGTFEFLVQDMDTDRASFAFLEVNPRLQVEHTVTEEVTGVDLVRAQIEIAAGKSLSDLGLTRNATRPDIYAMQMRINMETIDEKGNALPSSGRLHVYEIPSGPGMRVDGYGYSGYMPNPAFDSLLAKLIITSRSPVYSDAITKARRSLAEFRIEGIDTNIAFLLNLLNMPELAQDNIHTRFIEENAATLNLFPNGTREEFFDNSPVKNDGLSAMPAAPPGTVPVTAPVQGCVVDIKVVEGDIITVGQKLVVLESMKMEHVILAESSGYVRGICVTLNSMVSKGSPLIFLEEAEITDGAGEADDLVDLDTIRPDLAAIIDRHALLLDENRPEAVNKRRGKNQRTARENIEDLCDPGTFIEYGALTVALQRSRRTLDDLMKRTPADGVVTGVGSINGATFADEKSRCVVMAYDYTVLAGTQGFMGHKKTDRMLAIANKWKLPLVLFAEGGGGRPGDVDVNSPAGLDLTTFNRFASISGNAPLIGIVEGPCFAGNAALLGCCDVIIATRSSNIGMGGPAMIEGGGLGRVMPEEIGPISIQTKNGVVDIEVANEAEAVAVTKKYLAYFQGDLPAWENTDQRLLRWLIPENRLRVYDVRKVIQTLADSASVLELRRDFGPGIVTALIRIEGRPFGLIANDCHHMGGAIEAEDADKAARFMQLCDAHRLPIISLCDTPGFMVGPNIEMRAQVRHVCRMFVIGSHITVPFFTVVLRKGYGLGAMAMSAGGFHDSFFTACWPTGEFGGMGLEGAVKHGFRKELEAITDLTEREKAYNQLVKEAYATGKATNMASYMEIDSVIDPAETRHWITRGLKSVPPTYKDKTGRSFVDPW